MSEALRPTDLAELRDAVAWAAEGRAPLAVLGGASKRGLGRPVQAARVLDLSALAGIVDYDPGELVLTAKAATPIAEVEAALHAARQHLAFEPPDLGPLLGAAPGRATLGGLLATNIGGPRRIQAGAPRDHFLGFQAVSGRAEVFKSGGRVVKNVTGFDLSKLMAGSHGTLAAMAEVTVRVLPAPEAVRTLLLRGLSDEAAVRALAAALQSPGDVSGAAHLPETAAAGLPAEALAGAGALTAVRIEGPEPSVAARGQSLARLLAGFGPTDLLADGPSRALWRAVRDVAPFAGAGERVVWRLSVPPSEGPTVVKRIARPGPAEAFYDWGGGLVWLALPPAADARHEDVRAAAGTVGGHATLVRAPESVRASVPVFEPQSEALARLARRVKEAFDPLGVLNPGRMYAGV
ncbi:MAG: glycolate oxidase subunit GlcE [Proteobacteria bacterium]|nr:glycolate oxidase subunit GlcE [Pseudomonadota bacterium]